MLAAAQQYIIDIRRAGHNVIPAGGGKIAYSGAFATRKKDDYGPCLMDIRQSTIDALTRRGLVRVFDTSHGALSKIELTEAGQAVAPTPEYDWGSKTDMENRHEAVIGGHCVVVQRNRPAYHKGSQWGIEVYGPNGTWRGTDKALTAEYAKIKGVMAAQKLAA